MQNLVAGWSLRSQRAFIHMPRLASTLQHGAEFRVRLPQVFEKRCKHIIFVSTVSLVQFLPEVTAARPVPSRSEPRHEAGWRVCTTSSLPTRCAKCRTHGAGSFLRAAWARVVSAAKLDSKLPSTRVAGREALSARWQHHHERQTKQQPS